MLEFDDLLPAIINATKQSHCNANMLKLGLNSAVKLIPVMKGGQDVNLRYLVTYDVLPIFGYCLKSDDTELVYLALWLLHELSTKSIGRPELRDLPMVVQGLVTLLSSTDTTTHLAALRTLKMLAHNYLSFQRRLIDVRVTRKVVACLGSESEDVRYWAIYLLHDLAAHTDSHQDVFEGAGFDILITCATVAPHPLSHYMADIIGFLCNTGRHTAQIANSGILRVVISFGTSQDHDLQYWAVALMASLIETSEVFARRVVGQESLSFLERHVLQGERTVIRVTASKVAVLLVKKEPGLLPVVESKMIQPMYAAFQQLFFEIIGTGDDAAVIVNGWTQHHTPLFLSENFGGMLESLEVFVSSGLFPSSGILSQEGSESDLTTILARLILMVETYSRSTAASKSALPGWLGARQTSSGSQSLQGPSLGPSPGLEDGSRDISSSGQRDLVTESEADCDVEDMTLNVTSSAAQLISTLAQFVTERESLLALDALSTLGQLVNIFEELGDHSSKEVRRRFTARRALMAFLSLSSQSLRLLLPPFFLFLSSFFFFSFFIFLLLLLLLLR